MNLKVFQRVFPKDHAFENSMSGAYFWFNVTSALHVLAAVLWVLTNLLLLTIVVPLLWMVVYGAALVTNVLALYRYYVCVKEAGEFQECCCSPVQCSSSHWVMSMHLYAFLANLSVVSLLVTVMFIWAAWWMAIVIHVMYMGLLNCAFHYSRKNEL